MKGRREGQTLQAEGKAFRRAQSEKEPGVRRGEEGWSPVSERPGECQQGSEVRGQVMERLAFGHGGEFSFSPKF